MSDIAFLSATELLGAFRRLELAPVEVLEAQIAEMQTRGADVNACTELLLEEARAAAERAGDTYARCAQSGQQPPALLGLTVATKEKHGIAGRSLESGLLAHRGRIADADHPVVQRIRGAGASSTRAPPARSSAVPP